MLVIKLSNGLIIKESSAHISRGPNVASLSFAIEPVYGEVFSPSLASTGDGFGWTVNGASYPDYWDNLKNASRDEHISLLFSLLSQLVEAYAVEAAGGPKEKRTKCVFRTDPETKEITPVYQETDPELYAAVMKETAQQPADAVVPRPEEVVTYATLEKKHPVGTLFDIVRAWHKAGVSIIGLEEV